MHGEMKLTSTSIRRPVPERASKRNFFAYIMKHEVINIKAALAERSIEDEASVKRRLNQSSQPLASQQRDLMRPSWERWSGIGAGDLALLLLVPRACA